MPSEQENTDNGTRNADLAQKFWSYTDAVRVAPPSEKLASFTTCAQLAAGLVSPEFPRADVVDRLEALAEATGIVDVHGVEAVQAALAAGFDEPIAPDPDDASDDVRPPELSDDAIALEFAEQHSSSLRVGFESHEARAIRRVRSMTEAA